MTKHTPAPWHANPKNAEREEKSVLGHSGGIIALVATDADAHLIAAAPETTEQLAFLLRWIDEQKRLGELPNVDFPAARAALAKAEGRS